MKASSDSFIFDIVIPTTRQGILTKDPKKFTFAKYKSIAKKEQNIFLEAGMNRKNIWVIEYNKKPYMFALFSENRITSFITLNKGTYRYFVPL
jgi:hypothetical protein